MTDTALLNARKSQARDWFETLRDRICSAFEALEQAAPANLYPGQPASFVRTPWQRPAGGGGVMVVCSKRSGSMSRPFTAPSRPTLPRPCPVPKRTHGSLPPASA